ISWARHVTIAGYLLFSSYYAYTKRSQVVVFPDGSIPVNFKRENDLIPMERTIRHSVVDKMYDLKMDRIQFALTRSLVALTDAPPDASPKMREIFLTEKSKSATCLLRYLQSRHGTQNGLHFFVDTINLISLLFRRVEVNKSYYAYRACLTNDIGASRLMAQLLLDQE
uniref:DUF155 domain-containing protein n=1 Tax=Panagrellus redivivus TaxID=6233 RepID=A0A7E4WBM4_PANRE